MVFYFKFLIRIFLKIILILSFFLQIPKITNIKKFFLLKRIVLKKRYLEIEMGSEAIHYEALRKQIILDKRISMNIQKKVGTLPVHQ